MKKTGDKQDGCAIFYKPDRFNLIKRYEIEYKSQQIGVMDRDNIGLALVLKPSFIKSTMLVIATTHLLFNPRRGEIQLGQLYALLSVLQRIKDRYKDAAVILTGDFNFIPESPLYRFVMERRIILHLDRRGLSGR